jgi:GNAT superfamily N-acetyltransferase
MSMDIFELNQKQYKAYQKQIFQIFLEQSVYQRKKSEEQKEQFKKWVEIYFKNWPDWFFVAVEGDQVLGYICACPNSELALRKINFRSYHLFNYRYPNYPVHFHINVKAGITGKGIGSKLLSALKIKALKENHQNLHIITSEHEKNVTFYRKHQFKVIDQQSLNDHNLLLMALDLGPGFRQQADKNL